MVRIDEPGARVTIVDGEVVEVATVVVEAEGGETPRKGASVLCDCEATDRLHSHAASRYQSNGQLNPNFEFKSDWRNATRAEEREWRRHEKWEAARSE